MDCFSTSMTLFTENERKIRIPRLIEIKLESWIEIMCVSFRAVGINLLRIFPIYIEGDIGMGNPHWFTVSQVKKERTRLSIPVWRWMVSVLTEVIYL
jgi:hypothetical protein